MLFLTHKIWSKDTISLEILPHLPARKREIEETADKVEIINTILFYLISSSSYNYCLPPAICNDYKAYPPQKGKVIKVDHRLGGEMFIARCVSAGG